MMRGLILSGIAAMTLFGSGLELEKVLVEESTETMAQETTSEEIKFTRQQDLAQILQVYFPEINMVRASAIGNDIVIRGFKRDDLNVLVDGAKIYGACPNRMDPPAMHVSISDIEKVEVIEGPFDVENFGSMAGAVKVITKDPQEGFGGDIEMIYGSYNYKKADVSLHAGDERFAFSVGITHESSDQYEDGDGKTLVEQNWAQLGTTDAYAYQAKYKDLPAYNRNSVRAKAIFRPTHDQELKLSFLSDKATDVLYPAFQMDAQLDKTLHANGEYSIKNLGALSKKLTLQAYYSTVTHDMGTEFRNAALNSMMYRTHHVKSKIKGAKLTNDLEALGWNWRVGVDMSLRNWNGICLNEPAKTPRQVRIPDVDTKNRALFAKSTKSFGDWSIKIGLRYDATDIDANGLSDPTLLPYIPALAQGYYRSKDTKSYNDVSANLVATYRVDEQNSFFVALGQGIRVPDAQELYFIGIMMSDIDQDGNKEVFWTRRGNPDLKEGKNREIDLGYEGRFDTFTIKATLFYSKVKDYIYAYKTTLNNNDTNMAYLTWANIDAHFYGADVSVAVPIGEFSMFEASAAYQRGKKDDLLPGQSDTDMAMVPPLRGRMALSYDDGDFFGMIEVLASAKYDNIDSDNGEQVLDGWSVVNIKGAKRLGKHLALNVGIDNLFDKTYALNNTYAGRALIGTDPVLINEPGRFIYANLNFSF